jgi:H+-transporting ATPase
MSDYDEKKAEGGEKGAALNGANDEYTQLIEFIRSQKTANADEETGNDTHIVKKRSFLTPWKVKEIRVNKNGEAEEVAAKVPASW